MWSHRVRNAVARVIRKLRAVGTDEHCMYVAARSGSKWMSGRSVEAQDDVAQLGSVPLKKCRPLRATIASTSSK